MKKITCSYGISCFVSGTEIDNKPTLLIDLNIKEYKTFTPGQVGWQTHDFPPGVSIQDKLYLNEESTKRVLAVLQDFLDTTYIHDTEATESSRGFKVLELRDNYSNKISMQESSNVDPAIWFGCETKNKVFVWQNNQLEAFQFPEGDVLLNDRLHLKTTQARKMKKAIEAEWQNAFVLSEKNQLSRATPEVEVTTKKKFSI